MVDLNSETNVLSLVLDSDSMFYGVFNSENHLLYSDRIPLNQCLTSSDYVATIEKAAHVNNGYTSINITIKTDQVSVLPMALDVPTHGPSPHQSILTDKLTGQPLHNAWTCDDSLLIALGELFTGRYLYHFSTVLANFIYPSHRNTLLAHIDKSHIHVIHYKSQDYRFYSMHDASSKEDYLYFIMQAFKLSGMDPSNSTLSMSGDIFIESELYNLLKRYISDIYFVQPELLQLKTTLPEDIKHRYFDLFATATCV